MRRVYWLLDHYTADDDVITYEFKDKAEALRRAPQIARQHDDGDSYFALKKFAAEGWRQNGMTCWNDFELEDDWDVRPDGIYDLITKKKVRPA